MSSFAMQETSPQQTDEAPRRSSLTALLRKLRLADHGGSTHDKHQRHDHRHLHHHRQHTPSPSGDGRSSLGAHGEKKSHGNACSDDLDSPTVALTASGDPPAVPTCMHCTSS